MYNEKYDLIETKRGRKVYLGYGLIASRKASTYISFNHIKEAISKIKTLINEEYFGTIDLGRPVGKSACLTITDENKDKVQMLYRNGKQYRTPVIINGKMQNTQLVTLGIRHDKKDKDLYYVFAAWYGPKAVREPLDKNIESEEERQECVEFWSNHALSMSPRCIDWERSKEVV